MGGITKRYGEPGPPTGSHRECTTTTLSGALVVDVGSVGDEYDVVHDREIKARFEARVGCVGINHQCGCLRKGKQWQAWHARRGSEGQQIMWQTRRHTRGRTWVGSAAQANKTTATAAMPATANGPRRAML